MISNLWIILMIVQCALVATRPTQTLKGDEATFHRHNYDAQNKPNDEKDEQVISVRITSSIAVGRSNAKLAHKVHSSNVESILNSPESTNLESNKNTYANVENETKTSEIPPKFIGANIEFLKQLNAKKDAQQHNTDQVHPFQMRVEGQFPEYNNNQFDSNAAEKDKIKFENEQPKDSLAEESLQVNSFETSSDILRAVPALQSVEKIRTDRLLKQVGNKMFHHNSEFNTKSNETYDTIAEPSNKSILTITNQNDEIENENIENVPLARSVSHTPSSRNYIQGHKHVSPGERGNSPSLTTVSFNVVHDTPNQSNSFNNEPSNTFVKNNDEPHKLYDPPKVYSEPAKIYSEPAKFYSEPAKIYSEPAKIYSEPAKIYSEPAKIYSEPAKFYSEPASLHLGPDLPNYTPWNNPTQSTAITNTPWQNTALSSLVTSTTPSTFNTLSTRLVNTQHNQLPEKNYEVDEKLSVLTDGRSHGVQETTTEKCKQDNCKVGYVVEGRQYKKYRVEERTPDGFIVGEYGVVRNEDGALRGVRYTADSDASPRLIYDALMKFLQL
ncbi:unnamed protein product [Diatraea saccharalis]|uniref:Uncharacterized protein n=1 Tax=Diatraea saccharalis TaxID=40085 RepID=A0A9P0C4L4_9NEOP|nr:unnamed protein product [Diatraea saccharalis]